jgi:transcriptional regulator with XRE-family HTH domain
MRRTGKQELLRLLLTDAMIGARKRAGLTQKAVANELGVSQGWVSKLESANHDHGIESVVSHLDAVGAELLMAVKLGEDLIPVETGAEETLVHVPSRYRAEASRQGMTLHDYICSSVEGYHWSDEVMHMPKEYAQFESGYLIGS